MYMQWSRRGEFENIIFRFVVRNLHNQIANSLSATLLDWAVRIGQPVGKVVLQRSGCWCNQRSGFDNAVIASISQTVDSGDGINLSAGATSVDIFGNFIGTDLTGTQPLGNLGHGVLVFEAFGNNIGGTADGQGNTIAFNNAAGVSMTDVGPDIETTGNVVSGNSIHTNGALGINLSNPNGNPTPNDLGNPPVTAPDLDEGANGLQNFPLISAVTNSSVTGTLDSTPNRSFQIELFTNDTADASGHGEGQTFIASMQVTTDDSGHASFFVSFVIPTIFAGQFVTATATDLTTNDTSEFSLAFEFIGADVDLIATAFDVLTDHVLLGESNLSFTIQNQGTADAGAFEVAIYLSDDDVINGDTLIQTVAFGPLAAGASSMRQVPILLPVAELFSNAVSEDPPGQGVGFLSNNIDHVGLRIDPTNAVGESDEANNVNRGMGLDKDDVTFFPWDIDSSGVVESTDAIFVINRLGQSVPPVDALADFDGDGLVTSADAIAAINRLGYLRNTVVDEAALNASTLESQQAFVNFLLARMEEENDGAVDLFALV